MKINKIFPVLIFIGITVGFCLPIFRNLYNWGQMDWDQFVFWNAVARKTIIDYQQFPLWNPYVNGGNVLLAHPHAAFLSPFFISVLIFGPVIGLKINILVHMFLGLLGMFVLSRHLKLSKMGSYLASFIFMLNSIYALHLTDGHVEWMAIAFIPWGVLFFIKSIENFKYVLGAIFAIGLIIFSGAVHIISIFTVYIIFYSVLKSFQLKSFLPAARLLVIVLGVFLLCACQLIPMFEFINSTPQYVDENNSINISVLSNMLLNRQQSLTEIENITRNMSLGIKSYGWHEYGSYIGFIPIIFFVIGVIANFLRNWPLIITGLLCLAISFGGNDSFSVWSMLKMLPIYDSVHVPSRFILGFIFSLSLISAMGLDWLTILLKKMNLKINWSQIITCLLLLFVFVDLWLVNSPILNKAFVIQPRIVQENEKFAQRQIRGSLISELQSHSSLYPIFLSNSGVIEGYEIISIPRGDVYIESDKKYRGEAYLINSGGLADLTRFSPNKVEVNVNAKKQDILVLNQNFNKGWKVKINGKVEKVRDYNGLIAVDVYSGNYIVNFYYMPTSFLIGISITCLFVLGLIGYKLRGLKVF